MEFIDHYEAFINDCKHRLFEKFKISKDEFKKYLETIVEERKQCWFKTNGKLLLQEYHYFVGILVISITTLMIMINVLIIVNNSYCLIISNQFFRKIFEQIVLLCIVFRFFRRFV